MVEHKRVDRRTPEELEDKSHVKKKARQSLYDQLKAPGESAVPVVNSLAKPSIETPAALLADARSDEQRASLIMQLQQSYGNAYVRQVIERVRAEEGRKSMTAEVPLQTQADLIHIVNFDDGVGISLELGATLDGEEALPTTEEPEESEEPEEWQGEPEELLPPTDVLEDKPIDPATVSAQHNTERGGVSIPRGFGVCKPSVTRHITVNRGKKGLLGLGTIKYGVRAVLQARYRWEVQSQGKTDIAGADSPAVTAGTWQQVHDDLTPSSEPIPKSPRTKYWCQDLSEKHEQFHATDYQGAFNLYAEQAQAWLAGQRASSKKQARQRGNDALGTVMTNVRNRMGHAVSGPAEERAYKDGAPYYKARADAVRKRAEEERWVA
jgi:hypothetical protein